MIGVVLLLLRFSQAKKNSKIVEDDDNQKILSKRILDKDPDPPSWIGDAYCPPNTLHNGRGRGVATASCMAAATTVAATMPWGG